MNIVFLDVEDVKLLHAEQIEAFGGSHGIRDEGSLESAVNQAQAGFGVDDLHEFPFGMAAAYAFHIAQHSRRHWSSSISMVTKYLGLSRGCTRR